MGEWSDYFEDFPEEDPGYGLDPKAEALAKARAEKLRQEQAKLDAEISAIIERHRNKT